eukprot:1486953-Rhodomonas_salina.1
MPRLVYHAATHALRNVRYRHSACLRCTRTDNVRSVVLSWAHHLTGPYWYSGTAAVQTCSGTALLPQYKRVLTRRGAGSVSGGRDVAG